MKVFVVAVIFAVMVSTQALTLSEEQKAKLKSYDADCSQSSNVDKELVAKARQGEFVDDAKLKAYLYCLSKHIGFQNDSGKLQQNVIHDKINAQLNDEKQTQAIIEKCIAEKASPEDTTFEAVKCVYESSGKKAALL
uniref:OBP4 n=1 Tax=Hycleus phaleratus TaxID=1248972 RepID=A0A2U9NJH6_9CUCU|nr:OBP4 [Hycleus phaleratus]